MLLIRDTFTANAVNYLNEQTRQAHDVLLHVADKCQSVVAQRERLRRNGEQNAELIAKMDAHYQQLVAQYDTLRDLYDKVRKFTDRLAVWQGEQDYATVLFLEKGEDIDDRKQFYFLRFKREFSHGYANAEVDKLIHELPQHLVVMNGGLINHGTDAEPEWGVHT